jgi:hypothetical protein
MPQHPIHARSLALAQRLLALVLAGFLTGCFAVPTPYHPDPELDASPRVLPDIRNIVGEGDSNRALRLSHSTRSDVEKALGEPAAKSADDSVFVYAQHMFSGWGVVLPPLFPANGPLRQQTYFLQLVFDPQGVLRRYRVEPGEANDAGMGYTVSRPDRVPDSLLMP